MIIKKKFNLSLLEERFNKLGNLEKIRGGSDGIDEPPLGKKLLPPPPPPPPQG